jgi:hypothetical protein
MAIFSKRLAAAVAAVSVISGGVLAFTLLPDRDPVEREYYSAVPGDEESEGKGLARLETYWHDRLTYPTGVFNPAWVRLAAAADRLIPSGIPAGPQLPQFLNVATTEMGEPAAMSATGFIALGPKPLYMSSCSGCYDYGLTSGRINAVVIDPTTTTDGSIVAYAASVGGGVWKTTNCCSATTTWVPKTDDPLIATISIDTLAIDPSNHNTIYAGTGDLNFGSFSMGSQGILKSTDAGETWTTLGAETFGPALLEFAPNQFPQYDAVGKVRVDPNDGNKVVAGTKRGLFFSYDAGTSWTGPCLTNTFTSERQDITGLELSDLGATTRIIAAVGVRGYGTPVQYNLGDNGANGLYRATMPAAGCPVFTAISTNANGWTGTNAASGTKYDPAVVGAGNQLGRIDIAVAPSDANYVYAQVQAIRAQASCSNAQGCQLGAWRSVDGGTTWTKIPGSDGASLKRCVGNTNGDYPQNWYDQGIAVDPNNPNRVFFDTFEIWFWQDAFPIDPDPTGTWNNLTCGYDTANNGVHVDQHGLTFVPGSSSILLANNDGGVHGTITANAVTAGTDPVWFNMDSGFNTIEWYSGDISGNFATSATPSACGGAQDNGASAVSFTGTPTGPAQWNMGLGGDGFSCQIDPLGNRYYQGNNSGGISRCTSNCTTSGGGTWSSIKGGWSSDLQSFVLPINLFRGGIPGGDDCTGGACTHLLAGTTRVWETITGASGASWYVTNNPSGPAAGPGLTKGTLGNRSYINQVKYSPKYQTVAIVGTNDGNVQIGFNLGTGTASQARWKNVTGGNVILPNRPILGVALDPAPPARELPGGYAAVGGFNANTPTTPGHVFRVQCISSECATFTWADKTGNLPDIPVDSIIANPNIPKQVFAGTDWGLYYTDDITAAAPTWQRFDNGLPHAMIWDMSIDRGSTTLSVWTRSRGTYVWPLPNPGTPADLTPDSFTFAAQNDVPLRTVLTSETVTISGLDAAVTLGVANGEYSIDGGAFTAAAGAITNGQTLALRHTSANATSTTIATTVTVGTYSTSFSSTTTAVSPPDDTPDAFAFAERSGIATGAFVTSEARTIIGIDTPTAVSVSGGTSPQYSINGGAWTASGGTITDGQTLRVRHISATDPGTASITSVTVGTYTTPFKSTTTTVDRTPDAFTFVTQTGVEPATEILSNVITPAGYNTAIAVVAGPGASYRIDGGAWTTASGTINPGQTLQAKHTSASGSLAYSKTYLKVGGVTGYFTTRTK